MKKTTNKCLNTLSKPIVYAANVLAKVSSSSVSFCFTYQPDVPEKLRNLYKVGK